MKKGKSEVEQLMDTMDSVVLEAVIGVASSSVAPVAENENENDNKNENDDNNENGSESEFLEMTMAAGTADVDLSTSPPPPGSQILPIDVEILSGSISSNPTPVEESSSISSLSSSPQSPLNESTIDDPSLNNSNKETKMLSRQQQIYPTYVKLSNLPSQLWEFGSVPPYYPSLILALLAFSPEPHNRLH